MTLLEATTAERDAHDKLQAAVAARRWYRPSTWRAEDRARAIWRCAVMELFAARSRVEEPE